jgi:hypothetical protein
MLVSGANAAAAAPAFDDLFSATPPWGAQPSRITWAPDGRSFVYVVRIQDPSKAMPVLQYGLFLRAANGSLRRLTPQSYSLFDLAA